jgi:hypothetical protein
MSITTQYMSDYLAGLPEATDLEASVPILLASQNNAAVAVPVVSISEFKRYGKMQTIDNATGNISLDMSSYDVFCLNLIGNVVLTLAADPSPPYQCIIRVKQAGASLSTVTWPANFKFVDSIPPTMASIIGGVDLFIAASFENGRVELAKSGTFPA